MKYVKNCPQCSNMIEFTEFTNKGNLNRSIRNNKVCKSYS